MNNLTVYFNENMKGMKVITESALEEFKELIGQASIDTVLESSKMIAVCDFGPSILHGVYSNTNLPHDIVIEQIKVLSELVNEMVDIGYSGNAHMEEVLECINVLNTADTILGSPVYLYEKALEQFTNNLKAIDNVIVLEGAYIDMDEKAVMETMKKRTQAEFDLAFTNAFLGPDENFTMESMNTLIRLSNRYDEIINDEIILEASKLKNDADGDGKEEPHEVVVNGKGKSSSGQSGVRKAAIKVDGAARKASTKIKKGSSDAAAVGTVAKKAAGRFTGLVSSTLGKLDKMQKEERLEAVLQGGMRRRLSTLIRTAILTGGATAINPALGAIALLTSATLHKRSDQRLKNEMIQEYEGEIKLVQEKIRDAEAAGDRKKKYQLMRIESHLENNVKRIGSPVRLNKSKLRKG